MIKAEPSKHKSQPARMLWKCPLSLVVEILVGGDRDGGVFFVVGVALEEVEVDVVVEVVTVVIVGLEVVVLLEEDGEVVVVVVVIAMVVVVTGRCWS